MNLEAQWIVGFTDGEGCFHIGIAKHPEMSLGVQVLPELTIVQHERDIQVLHAIKQFFDCGVVRRNHDDRMCWRVRKLEHLVDRIVPFFEKHELKTRKRQDFISFRKVIMAMQRGQHLTPEGLDEIRRIVEQMRSRKGNGAGDGKVKSSPP